MVIIVIEMCSRGVDVVTAGGCVLLAAVSCDTFQKRCPAPNSCKQPPDLVFEHNFTMRRRKKKGPTGN